MTSIKKAELKIDHVYRIIGPALQNGWSNKRQERFEALRYLGTMVPYRNGFADVDNPVELFYSYAQRQHFLFKPGGFQAEELLD